MPYVPGGLNNCSPVSQSEPNPPQRLRPTSGQTLMFLGDHTSPDKPGYVAVVREVLGRFFPGLNLNLISAGGPGQTAGGLGSGALQDLLTSSRPDWRCVTSAST